MKGCEAPVYQKGMCSQYCTENAPCMIVQYETTLHAFWTPRKTRQVSSQQNPVSMSIGGLRKIRFHFYAKHFICVWKSSKEIALGFRGGWCASQMWLGWGRFPTCWMFFNGFAHDTWSLLLAQTTWCTEPKPNGIILHQVSGSVNSQIPTYLCGQMLTPSWRHGFGQQFFQAAGRKLWRRRSRRPRLSHEDCNNFWKRTSVLHHTFVTEGRRGPTLGSVLIEGNEVMVILMSTKLSDHFSLWHAHNAREWFHWLSLRSDKCAGWHLQACGGDTFEDSGAKPFDSTEQFGQFNSARVLMWFCAT